MVKEAHYWLLFAFHSIVTNTGVTCEEVHDMDGQIVELVDGITSPDNDVELHTL